VFLPLFGPDLAILPIPRCRESGCRRINFQKAQTANVQNTPLDACGVSRERPTSESQAPTTAPANAQLLHLNLQTGRVLIEDLEMWRFADWALGIWRFGDSGVWRLGIWRLGIWQLEAGDLEVGYLEIRYWRLGAGPFGDWQLP
jgi:hypothetical protein